MKEDNQAVIKALNMYGRVPEMWELLEEIERLNKCCCERTDCSGRIKNSKKYESMQEEIERLNNIINKALGIANERVNYYHHTNKKEILEDWENIFNVLLRRDNE